MINNYLKTTARYLWKNKLFSMINIAGLTIGICVGFFAMMWVKFELSHDRYNRQADHIYRLVTDIVSPESVVYESTPAPMGLAIQSAFPGIKAVARIFMDDMILQSGPNNASKEEVAYADSTVFTVFTWPLLRGNVATAFNAPNNAVLSETAARKYFGSSDPIGQTLMINGQTPARVTGVMKDIPYNSHLRVDVLFSITTLVDDSWSDNWTRFGFYTYLLLDPAQSPGQLKSRLPDFVKTNMDQSQFRYKLDIEPLNSVYLSGKPRGHRTGSSASGSIINVYIVSITALLVLSIACFNFINLTTAFSLQRSKEIGVRKVLGASRILLALQFFLDAILLSLLSFVMALFLAALLSPLFNQITNMAANENVLTHLDHIGWLLLIAVGVGTLSGIYPALFLSAFQPIMSLKGKFGSSGTGLVLRRCLVVAQFCISIFLIIATAIVYLQLHFMQNDELGFEKGHKLVIDYQFDRRINQNTAKVKDQFSQIPGVTSVSFSSSVPGTPNNKFNTILENSRHENLRQKTDVYFIDDNFLKQYDISLIAGRGFSTNLAADSMQSMLINESMVNLLGFKNAGDAIGKHFTQLMHEGTIVGVIKDFHNHSFLEKVEPLTMRVDPGHLTNITIDIHSEKISGTIGKLEAAWKSIAPGLPFIYFFADDAFNQQYVAQQRFAQLFTCFSTVAICLCCLGLMGLSAYSIAQRRKEISIRKVLGVTVSGITLMLSRDFIRLIGIAFVIISPITYWLMKQWLQRFAYRIDLPVWVFFVSGLSAVFIALATISFQSVKAALVNPINNLRAE